MAEIRQAVKTGMPDSEPEICHRLGRDSGPQYDAARVYPNAGEGVSWSVLGPLSFAVLEDYMFTFLS